MKIKFKAKEVKVHVIRVAEKKHLKIIKITPSFAHRCSSKLLNVLKPWVSRSFGHRCSSKLLSILCCRVALTKSEFTSSRKRKGKTYKSKQTWGCPFLCTQVCVIQKLSFSLVRCDERLRKAFLFTD